MTTIATHHQHAIDRIVMHFSEQPEVIAILLGGSIAKGVQTDASDIDVMIVLDDAEITRRQGTKQLSEVNFDFCEYPGGYADIKYISKDFLVQAAEHGSEPARNAFIGTHCLFTHDKSIPQVLSRIPVYPLHEQHEKILSFYSSILISRWLWSEGQRRNDPYLRMRAMTDIVLFGCRLILAHNETIFPCQKRLVEATVACPEKPEQLPQLLHAVLGTPSDETISAFIDTVINFRDWGVGTNFDVFVTRYIEDHEQWWFKQRPYIAEW